MPTLPPEKSKFRCPWKTRACLAAFAAFAFADIGYSQTVLVDFGPQFTTSASTNGPDANGNYWNNINSAAVTNLVTTANATTGWRLDYGTNSWSFNPAAGSWAPNPLASLGNLAIATATADGAYVANGAQTFNLTNLNAFQTYDLLLYGARDISNARSTTYIVAGTTTNQATLQTSGLNLGGTGTNYNNANVSSFAAIAPNASGVIAVTYTSSTFAYLNAMQLVGYVAYTNGGTTNVDTAKEYPGATYINGGTTVNANVAGALPTNTPTALTISNSGSALNLGASQSVSSLTGYAGTAITVSNGTTLTVSGSANSSHAGTVSGGGTLLKTNSGSLELSASNAFTGTATVSGGTLALANTGALQNATLDTGSAGSQSVSFTVAGSSTYTLGALSGADDLSMGGNSLVVGGKNTNTTFSGALSGSGSLTKSGSGTFTLSGANTHSGGTVLSAGRININNASALGSGTLSMSNGTSFNNTSGGALSNANNNVVVLAGTNTFTGSASMNLGTGNVSISEATRLVVGGNSLTIGGTISGSAGLNKDGIGTLTLAGSNAMTSYTVLDYGILNLANTNALANAQLYLYGSGSNKMVTFGVAGSNTYNLGALSGSSTGLLTLGGNSVNIGGANDNTTFSGVVEGSGSVTKSGTGTFTLAGANTHSGGVTVNSGQLNINNASALGTGTYTVANGARFDNTSGGTISNANNNLVSLGGTNTFVGSSSLHLGTGNVALSSATRLSVNANNLTIAGNVSGTEAFNKDGVGTLTLAGSNAMTSYTVLDYGVLNLAHTNALANAQLYLYGSGSNKTVAFGAAGTNTYNIGALAGAADAVLTLGANSVDVGRTGVTTTFGGVVQGTGALIKSGSGTITLSGANTHSGGTAVSAGQLNINNALALGTGTFTLGNGTKFDNTSGGALTNTQNNAISLGGSNTFLGSSSLNLGTGTVTLGGNSQLDVTGALQVGGNVSGSSTLTKAGNGTLTLAGTNFGSAQLVVTAGTLTLTDANRGSWVNTNGAIRLEGGTLSMVNGNNLGAYPAAVGVQVQFAGNSTLRFDGSGTLNANRGFAISNGTMATIDVQGFTPTMNNVVQGGGTLNKTGAGALTLAGANTHSGGTTLSAGQLNINSASALGTGTFTMASGTTFDNTSAAAITNTQNNAIVLASTNTFAGTRDLHLGNGSVTFSGNTRLNVNANNLTLGGNLSGSGAFNKDGIGTLTFAGSNSMTSYTVVDYGVLNLANTNALANAQLYLYGSGTNKMVTFGLAGANTYKLGALSGASDGILTLGANSVDVGGANITTSFNGLIEGTGSLIKSGTGSLTLGNANTYSGGTMINGGTLLAGHAQAFGSGSVTVGSGTVLDLGSYVVANSLINNGGTIYSTGTLDNISASSGTTDVGGNNSQIASISGTATVNITGTGAQINAMSGGSLNIGAAGAAVTNFTGGNIGVSNGLAITLREGNSSGVISGAGAIEKQSSGTLTLSGNNSHAGGTSLSSGRLNINSASALGTGAFTLGNGASFNNTSGGAISNANNNAISIAGTNTFAGTDNLHLGSGNVTIGAASRLIVSSGALTLGGSVSGSAGFNKDGGGKLTLIGSNAMTSYTVVDFGILELGNVNALANAQLYLYGSTTNKMVTFGVAGNNTYNLGALSGSATGVLTLGSNSVSVGANNVATTYAGTIEGTGGVTKTGSSTLTLSGTSTYGGTTTVSSGKLVVNGAIASSAVTIANGAEVGGNGTSGTLTVQNGGTIAPGNSAGTFSINGDIVWQNGGSYDWEIFNLAGPAGSGWDLIDATGPLDLNGLTGASDFVINLFSLSGDNSTPGVLAAFDANSNYDWMIASFSGLSGSFDLSKFTVNTAGFTAYNSVGTGLFSLEISESEDSLYLTYRAGGAPVPEPGTWAAGGLLAAIAAVARWRRSRRAGSNG